MHYEFRYLIFTIFCLRCVIAELFLEGQPLFELSQLLAYRRGQYDPSQHLEKVCFSWTICFSIFTQKAVLTFVLSKVPWIEVFSQAFRFTWIPSHLFIILHECRFQIQESARWFCIWFNWIRRHDALLKVTCKPLRVLCSQVISRRFFITSILCWTLWILMQG